jgi:TRAP transporter TAXI family solute receptor
MEREQYQQLAIGAGILAVIIAITSGRLPRWVRVMLVVGVAAIAAGAGLLAYRYATTPTTLTVVAGSLDGDAPRLMSAVAAKMTSTGSTVRLKVIDKGTTLEAVKAFAAGEADLAIARADTGNLSDARTVVTATHAIVMIVVPPGSSIESMDELKGKTVGVIGGELNHQIVAALTKEYDLGAAKVHFKDIALADVAQALKSKQVVAILVVMPVTEKYLGMLRELFPRNAKKPLGIVPIESAGAIAAVARAYESYDLPKGTLRGSPAVPDDDMTTLRVPFYLVANRKLSDDVVGALTKAVMDTRRDLVGEFPLLAQISAPSTDKDAFIPIHPGAAAYFDGDQKTLFDRYGDQFFYGSMILGSLMSILAAAWKFMTKDAEDETQRPLDRLYALVDQINEARSETDLAKIESSVDEILKPALDRISAGGADAAETNVLGLATHRLEYLLSQRRTALSARPG